MKSKTLWLAMLVSASFRVAAATEYIVSTPTEIRARMLAAQPGDTLTMTPGIWNNARIVFKGNGSASAPIVLRAQAYGSVIISGSSNLRISGRYLVVDGLVFWNGSSPSGAVIEFRDSSGSPESHNCRLTNSAIINYNPPNTTSDYKWVSLYGTYNRVDRCFFKGKTHLGTTLVVWMAAQPNYHLIDRNHFGFRPVYPENGAETIRIGTSDWSLYNSRTIVEYNYFEECNGEIETISNKSCENIYRYNTFVSTQGTLTLRHGNRCRVEGNFFFQNYAPNSGGIRIIGEDHTVINNYLQGGAGNSFKTAITIMNGIPNSPLNGYFQVKRALVAFNTLFENRYSLIIGAGKDTERTLPPLDCVIANNIVYSSTSPLIQWSDTPINMRWEGNIFYGASIGTTTPPGVAIVNPQFVQSDSIWRPAATSPAVNAAAGQYDSITTDMDGQPRGGAKDVGADEHSTAPITNRPLRPNDVGPLRIGSIQLAAFSVTNSGTGALTRWTTGMEQNSVRFELQRRLAGQPEFASVPGVNVAGAGNSIEPKTYSVSDNSVTNGRWEYRLKQLRADGTSWFGPVAVVDIVTSVERPSEVPLNFILFENYPNPFNPVTTLRFKAQRSGRLLIAAYNTLGEKISTIFDGEIAAMREYTALFNATDLPSGIYYARLQFGEQHLTRAMVLVR